MKKISIVAPSPEDITSYYRVIRPYGEIVKNHPTEFEVNIDTKIDTIKLFQTHIALFQRPFNKQHLEQILTCKYLDIPVIVDLDDNLLEVPEGNPAHHYYCNKETLAMSKEIYKAADVITVTTPALRNSLLEYNSNIEIIENAYDPVVFKPTEIDWTKRNKIVLWRGGGTHAIDLNTVLPQLAQITKERPDWTFVFFGGKDEFNDYVLKPLLGTKNVVFIKSQSMLKYAENMQQLKPSIMIVPLLQNNFNEAKSNIAWIEGNASGAVVVAPNMGEWNRPGILTYDHPRAFKTQLEYLMDNFNKTPGLWKESNEYIQNNLLLDKINQKRIKLLNDL
jgi:glycosyltransferase involved in cell wall biosynthesis